MAWILAERLYSVLTDKKPNGRLDRTLKEMCPFYYEQRIGIREEFIKEFGRNYL